MIVGLRPEALEPADDGLAATVDMVEELGSDAFARCTADLPGGAMTLTVRIDPWKAPQRGGRVSLRPRPGQAHLFDPETGDRLGSSDSRRVGPMTTQPKAGTAARPSLLRHMNERTVLEAIRERAPISRAKISRPVGISKPTVSVALRSLLDAGLVRETTAAGDGPSYGATFFEPVPDAAMVLGLDLAPASCAARSAISAVRCGPARTWSCPTPRPRRHSRPPPS